MDEESAMSIKNVVQYPDGRMDTQNAANYTGKSSKTLAMMRCNGTGPKFIKRGRVFYFKDDVDAWINAGGRVSSRDIVKSGVRLVCNMTNQAASFC